jgi:hypothetical protein
MKLRNPKEFAAAVTRIRTALGEEACAQAVGRSESLVRKWADPDHPGLPGIEHALVLDAAYVAGGHGEAPLLNLYESLLEDAISDNTVGRDELVPSALMIQAIVGDLSAEIRDIINPQTSTAASGMSADSQSRLLRIIDRLEDETERLEDAVEAAD